MPSGRSGAPGVGTMAVQVPVMHAWVSLHAVEHELGSVFKQLEKVGSLLALPLTMALVMQALPLAHRPAQRIGELSATVMVQSPAPGLAFLAVATRSSDLKPVPTGMPVAM